MKLSICTDVFGKIPFTEMLDKVKNYGIDAIELTTGGWGAVFLSRPRKRSLRTHENWRLFKKESTSAACKFLL